LNLSTIGGVRVALLATAMAIDVTRPACAWLAERHADLSFLRRVPASTRIREVGKVLWTAAITVFLVEAALNNILVEVLGLPVIVGLAWLVCTGLDRLRGTPRT
jgi:hypothetical protein